MLTATIHETTTGISVKFGIEKWLEVADQTEFALMAEGGWRTGIDLDLIVDLAQNLPTQVCGNLVLEGTEAAEAAAMVACWRLAMRQDRPASHEIRIDRPDLVIAWLARHRQDVDPAAIADPQLALSLPDDTGEIGYATANAFFEDPAAVPAV